MQTKEERRAYLAIYRAKNRERLAAYNRALRKANLDHFRKTNRDRTKKWRLAHPEKWAAIRARCDAKRRDRTRNDAQYRDLRNAAARARWLANIDRYKALQAAWRNKNRQRIHETQRLYRAENKERLRLGRIKRNFNVDYKSLLLRQGGRCAIFGCLEIEKLTVDHDHSCCPGKKSCGRCVRGLICGLHNSVLGFSKDSPSFLYGTIDYLERTAPCLTP